LVHRWKDPGARFDSGADTKKAGGCPPAFVKFELPVRLPAGLVAPATVATVTAVTTAATATIAATATAAAAAATVAATATAAATVATATTATAAGLVATAAAATTAISTAAATATGVGTLFTGTGLVDRQGTAINVFTVEGLNGGIGFTHIRHGDEGKTLRPAGEFVHNDAGLVNGAISSELGCQRGLGRFVSEVSNVYFHVLCFSGEAILIQQFCMPRDTTLLEGC
jgi:hypothetical protein